MTIPKATSEIGIVLYPGVQAASVHGFTDLFGIAGKMALNGQSDARSPLRVTHWQAAHGSDADLSCVCDSDQALSPERKARKPS
jgi:transcriptional regulator GlxA family with amidase domain